VVTLCGEQAGRGLVPDLTSVLRAEDVLMMIFTIQDCLAYSAKSYEEMGKDAIES
jgi:hypothetical protein